MPRVAKGDRLEPFTLESLAHGEVRVPDGEGRFVHLQFRRFAGCPICNLHLRSFAGRVGELEAAGVREVALFHSEAETMRPYQGDLPFAVVADPDKALYRRFGVEAGWRAMLDPRGWPAAVRGMFGRHRWSLTRGEGGHLGLPADLLVGPDGVVVDAQYGRHAYDQWSVDEVVARVEAARAAGRVAEDAAATAG